MGGDGPGGGGPGKPQEHHTHTLTPPCLFYSHFSLLSSFQEAECKEAVRGWEALLAWVLAARYQMALALAASHLSSLAARRACTMALQAGR